MRSERAHERRSQSGAAPFLGHMIKRLTTIGRHSFALWLLFAKIVSSWFNLIFHYWTLTFFSDQVWTYLDWLSTEFSLSSYLLKVFRFTPNSFTDLESANSSRRFTMHLLLPLMLVSLVLAGYASGTPYDDFRVKRCFQLQSSDPHHDLLQNVRSGYCAVFSDLAIQLPVVCPSSIPDSEFNRKVLNVKPGQEWQSPDQFDQKSNKSDFNENSSKYSFRCVLIHQSRLRIEVDCDCTQSRSGRAKDNNRRKCEQACKRPLKQQDNGDRLIKKPKPTPTVSFLFLSVNCFLARQTRPHLLLSKLDL